MANEASLRSVFITHFPSILTPLFLLTNVKILVYFSHAGKKQTNTPLAFKFLTIWIPVLAGYCHSSLPAPEEVAPWFKHGLVPPAAPRRRNASVASWKAAERTLSLQSPGAELLSSLLRCGIYSHLEKHHVFTPPQRGYNTLQMHFHKVREVFPIESCGEMDLKPLWDVQKKETYRLSVHPNVWQVIPGILGHCEHSVWHFMPGTTEAASAPGHVPLRTPAPCQC